MANFPQFTPEGYAYVPIQIANDRNLYSPENGLVRGTIFPTLDLPLGVYGNQDLTREVELND
ncbi:MAG: spore coat associated protein CotJA [Clostridia bacterium]|nr:spore coat associated protein CotJA [Clostridia bacterium]